MSRKKRIILTCVLGAIFIVLCVAGAAALISHIKKVPIPKETEPVTVAAKEPGETQTQPPVTELPADTTAPAAVPARTDYTYTNLDGLYFIPSEKHDTLKAALGKYFADTNTAANYIIYTGKSVASEDLNFFTFWLLVDSKFVLRTNFNYELNEYVFAVETDSEIKDLFVDPGPPDGVDDPDAPYDYGELEISNLDRLRLVLPEEAFLRFPEVFQEYLDSLPDLRKFITLAVIEQDGDTTSWICVFDTPRRDNKNINASYSAADDFKFSLTD